MKSPEQNIPDINAEFQRLKSLVETEHGFQSFDDCFQRAMNYEKRDGAWYKKGSSDGDKVAGFAFDPITKEFKLGLPGQDHYAAKSYLIRYLKEKEKPTLPEELQAIQNRVHDGRAAYTDQWKFPLVLVYGMMDIAEAEEIDKVILEKKIGLPISTIVRKHLQKSSNQQE